MLIADAQVHIWGPNTPEYPWVEGRKPHRPTPLSEEELLREMDAAGVRRAVLVPPSIQGNHNDMVLAAARAHPDRFGCMGLLDLKNPSARTQIATWRDQSGMLGLRHSFNMNKDDGSGDWLWREAEKAGVPIMLMADNRLNRVDELARLHPALKLVLDHLAIPHGKKDEEAFAHLEQLLALAQYPNIAVKASALPCHTDDVYPFRRLHPYIRRVYDVYGPKRMFWGTDFSRLPCTYTEALTYFTKELPWLTTEDKEWIMGRGLCEWIGWKLPAPQANDVR